MTLTRCLMLFSLVALFVCSTTARAETADEIVKDALHQGVLLAQTNKWEVAANHWERALKSLQETKNAPEKDIAFLLVLQTISLEKAKDGAAYDAWTAAINLYLNSGVSWVRERQALKQVINNTQFNLTASAVGEGGVSVGLQRGLVLASLDRIMRFSTYEGPEPGLKKKEDSEQSTLTVARSYFPRPQIRDGDGLADSERRSRFATEDEGDVSSLDALARGAILAQLEGDATFEEGERRTSVSEIKPPRASPTVRVTEAELPLLGGDEPPLPKPTLVTQASVQEDATAVSADAPAIARRLFNRAQSPLSQQDLEIGKRAWRYFENNRQSNTGLFNSVENYPFTTMWDLGSSLAALHCAHEIGVIDDIMFSSYVGSILNTLSEIPLYDGELPNREYDTRSGLMTDLKNQVDDKGSGYSAIDIARVLTWLAVISENHSVHTPVIDAIVGRWRLERAIDNGEFHRELLVASGVDRKQEGRFGYEQYTGIAFDYWGRRAADALDADETERADVDGVSVLRDVRDPNHLNLEPFLLTMMEYDTRPDEITEATSALIASHSMNYEETGELKFYSEDSTDEPPWFLYNTITSKDGNWVCKNSRGDIVEKCQQISTKAVFAAASLYESDELDLMRSLVVDNFDVRLGYYAGFYDEATPNRALNANTNAVILQSLAFKKRRGAPFLSNAALTDFQMSRSRAAN